MATRIDALFPNETDDAVANGVNDSFPLGQSFLLDEGLAIDAVWLIVEQDFSSFGQSPPSDESVWVTIETGTVSSLTTQATSNTVALDELAEFTGTKTSPTQFTFASPYTTVGSAPFFLVLNTDRATSNPGVQVWTLVDGGYYEDGHYADVGNGSLETDRDLEFKVVTDAQILYIQNRGFRFPYLRWQ